MALPTALLPIGLFISQSLLTAVCISFTQTGSIKRVAALPLALVFPLAVLQTSILCMRARWASLLTGISLSFFLQFLDLCFFKKISLANEDQYNSRFKQPTSIKASSNTSDRSKQAIPQSYLQRLYHGIARSLSFRGINTSWEVKNVPDFGPNGYVPSRRSFLAVSATRFIFCYLFIDVTGLMPPPEHPGQVFGSSTVPLFYRATSLSIEQLQVRSMSTILYWLIMYCVMSAGYDFAAICCVSLGSSDVSSWKPLFNSPTKGYTLRKFWGVFWHQILRDSFSKPADFISDQLFGLARGTTLSTHVRLFLVFLLSGILHATAEVAGGLALNKSGTILFFLTQAAGITFEDLVLAISKRLGVTVLPHYRLLGYIWITTFMIWSTPAWLYPDAALGVKKSVLPWSFFRWFLDDHSPASKV